MAKLILSMDGLVLKEIPLSKERTTIGRKPSNDIQIDNLAVSGEHAVIVTIMNDSFLEDLGSTNGTIVNGNPVKKHFLQNNDVVELGKYKLKFLAEPGVQPAAAADFEKTMVLRPSTMKSVVEQARAAAPGGGQKAAEQARAAAVQQAASAAASAGMAAKDTTGSSKAHTPSTAPSAGAAPAAAPAAAPGGGRAGPGAAGGAEAGATARCHPDPFRLERGQGARAGQAADHARQARRAGRGADASPAGLLHHACRGREAAERQRPVHRHRAARAQGSRRDRACRREDGILRQGLIPGVRDHPPIPVAARLRHKRASA